jgi:hypothetical protein
MDREKESCSGGKKSQRKSYGKKNYLQRYFLIHELSFAAVQPHRRQTQDVRKYCAATVGSTRGLLFFPAELCSPTAADAQSQLLKNIPILLLVNFFLHDYLPLALKLIVSHKCSNPPWNLLFVAILFSGEKDYRTPTLKQIPWKSLPWISHGKSTELRYLGLLPLRPPNRP